VVTKVTYILNSSKLERIKHGVIIREVNQTMNGDAASRMSANKTHFLVGVTISLVVTILVAMDGNYFWFLAKIISVLLSFAGVEFNLFLLGSPISLLKGIPLYYRPAGPTFEIPVNFVAPDPSTSLLIIFVIALVSFLVYQTKRIVIPVKAIWLIFSALLVTTLLYLAFVSPIPPHRLSWVTVDWSCSGVVILALITFIFTPFLFTVKGPLWIKLLFLALTIGFSVLWNIVRLSLTIASLYYFGDLVFLLLHYIAGVFVDFIYIVTFYSLALGQLAKHETSVTGW
jgi:exosortase/archaeosortase family protein